MRIRTFLASLALVAIVPATSFANLTFDSTSNPASWQVAVSVGGPDGQFASFPTSGFAPAVAITNRTDWIADIPSGTHGPVGTWTFFVFEQSFDLTGFDPGTANLQFRWGADDTGEGFADRGTWNPKYSLNDGALVRDTAGFYTLGGLVTLTSGFVPGVNTLKFYVEGNGTTDGMVLSAVDFTAQPVPEPASATLLLAAAPFLLRRRRQN